MSDLLNIIDLYQGTDEQGVIEYSASVIDECDHDSWDCDCHDCDSDGDCDCGNW